MKIRFAAEFGAGFGAGFGAEFGDGAEFTNDSRVNDGMAHQLMAWIAISV